MDNCVDLDPLEYRLGENFISTKMPVSPEQDASHLVESLVSNNRIVIFSKSSCPHCDDTKYLLSSKGVQYKAVELDKMKEGKVVQNTLGRITDARTVPRVFINGQCVGGNSDLQSLAKNGLLTSLLGSNAAEDLETLDKSESETLDKSETEESESSKDKEDPQTTSTSYEAQEQTSESESF